MKEILIIAGPNGAGKTSMDVDLNETMEDSEADLSKYKKYIHKDSGLKPSDLDEDDIAIIDALVEARKEALKEALSKGSSIVYLEGDKICYQSNLDDDNE